MCRDAQLTGQAGQFNGAKAAVYIGERLLIYLRDDDPGIPWPGYWDFPGGGREGDETPEETLSRELAEEFGLDMAQARVEWKRAFPAAHDPAALVWFFVLSFPAGTEDRIVFGDEGQRWELCHWQVVASLPNLVPSFAPRMALWLARDQETGRGG